MGYLAIDFGGTRTRAAWFDADMGLLQRDEMRSEVGRGPDDTLERIAVLAKRVIPQGKKPLAVGVAAPGPLDTDAGVIHHAETLPGWRHVMLAPYLHEALGGVPVWIQNDANLGALAEYAAGAGQGADPMLYLTISTGIGGGAILDGRLFTGWRGLAIEPGHQRIPLPDGSLHRLEDLASGTAIGKRAAERLAGSDRLSSLRDVAHIDGQAVGQAALDGDLFAQEIIREAGYYLGIGLLNLLHLFNPQAIVLGGSVMQIADLILKPAREVIQTHILSPDFYEDTLIRVASLGDDVCLTGAAHYARLQASL